MPTLVLFHEAGKYEGDGTFDFDGHTWKAVLTNTAPVQATGAVLADITQISAGNGYSTGGVTLSSVTWAETGAGTGIWQFTCADFSWTASGGTIGPFRYVVIYDDTPTSPADPLFGYLDWGTGITLPDGGIFTVDVQSSGLYRKTVP